MRRVGWLVAFVSLTAAAGCSGTSGGVSNIDGGCTSCVPDGGRFAIYVVDPTVFNPPGTSGQSQVIGFETIPLFQMRLSPSGNIGIAYIEFSADQTDNKPDLDPNVYNADILYVEVTGAGNLVVGPEHVVGTGNGTAYLPVDLQDFTGVTLDYQEDGQPAVAYNGWAQQLPTFGFDALAGGPSSDGGTRSSQAYWFQHNAVVSYRSAGGAWTQQTAAMDSEQAAAASPTCAADGSCSMGTIVGLYPAIYIDGAETVLAYRDVHFGSSTGTGDFDNSNLGIAYGGPTMWQYTALAYGKPPPGIVPPQGPCAIASNLPAAHTAFGNHMSFIHGDNNNPALISDIGANEYNSNGTNTVFFERKAGTWSCPLSLLKIGSDSETMVTETGPSIAYDGSPIGQGYAVVVSDISGSGAALYKNCAPGLDCTALDSSGPKNWTVFQTLPQSGSSGYFASVALNPTTHDPWVAYYFCSSNTADTVGSCPTSQRQLQVATNNGNGEWIPEPVDNQGAWQTQSLYLTNPTQLVIGYRDPSTGAMKIAVENPP
jgi:hypothetical protein